MDNLGKYLDSLKKGGFESLLESASKKDFMGLQEVLEKSKQSEDSLTGEERALDILRFRSSETEKYFKSVNYSYLDKIGYLAHVCGVFMMYYKTFVEDSISFMKELDKDGKVSMGTVEKMADSRGSALFTMLELMAVGNIITRATPYAIVKDFGEAHEH